MSQWKHSTLPMAAIAGLMEGLTIARYDVRMADTSIAAWLASVGTVLAITAVHIAIWSLLDVVLRRIVRTTWVAPLVFTIWVLVVGQGRELLDDRTIRWGWQAVGVGLLLGWFAGLPKLPTWLAATFRTLAVTMVAFFGLLGRAPDYSFPAPQQLGMLVSSALLAAALVWSIRAWPKIALGVCALGLLGGAVAGMLRAQAEDRPNVLWILIDTARQDYLEPYSDRVSTPAIARLAREGVLFEDAVTVVPKTPASVASFLTGTYPAAHGVRSLYDRLPEERETVAEAFRSAGYQTAAFVHNAWLSRGRGFGQGFDRFNGFYEVSRPYGPWRYVSWVVLFDRLTTKTIEIFDGETRSEALTDSVLDYLGSHSNKPFFVYAHYFEPHWPYYPPAELAEQYGGPADGDVIVNHIKETRIGRGNMIFRNPLPEEENEKARALYRAEIDNTMSQVGRLVDGLDALDLKEDTLVVFTADHGHALGEHDYYFHHGEFLYDASLQIPLILRWPGHLPEGQTVAAQVRSIDVAPTVASLVGLRGLDGADGVDLSRFWLSEVDRPIEALIESDVTMFPENKKRRPLRGIVGKLRAFRDGRHKLILTPTPSGLSLELYDLQADPEELHDVADDEAYSEIREYLLSRLFEELPQDERTALSQLAAGGGSEDGAEKDVDENELEMLRSLGYI